LAEASVALLAAFTTVSLSSLERAKSYVNRVVLAALAALRTPGVWSFTEKKMEGYAEEEV
jgi:hypothetical protein